MWATPQVLVLTPSANTSAIEPSARIPLHQSHVIPLEKVWGCRPVLVHISNPSNEETEAGRSPSSSPA